MKIKTLHSAEVPVEGQWLITSNIMSALLVMSTVTTAIGFLCLYAYAKSLSSSETILDAWCGTPLGIVFSLPLCLLHEWVHGLAYQRAKAKPRYGFKLVGGVPVFYTTASGHWLTRNEYIVIGIAPTIIVSLFGLLLMYMSPNLRNAFLMAVAIHFGGCIGDWFMIGQVLRLPKRTQFEDMEEGFRHRLMPMATGET